MKVQVLKKGIIGNEDKSPYLTFRIKEMDKNRRIVKIEVEIELKRYSSNKQS